MNTELKFTSEDKSELTYLLYNAPVDIAHRDKRIVPMNGLWYPFVENRSEGDGFENFHDAIVWLLNPFWEQANGHPYA
jgi:hypothetical protein